MTSFIAQILQNLLSESKPLSEYTFILPSKRAGAYLLKELASMNTTSMFSPKVYSIEEFVEKMSGLKALDNTSALFEFYSVYSTNTDRDKTESFETFSSWAQTLLYDFNEIDRYLINAKSFFGYLSNIQEINHWYLQPEKTPLMINYLAFWHQLPQYYQQLSKQLQQKELGYQGLIYRKASENVKEYNKENKNPHVFIGFNALNNAEQKIIQTMLDYGNTKVFWDIDETFFNNEKHAASLFMREYRNKWPYYSKNPFQVVSNSFKSKKNIEIIGTPKNIGQAKYVGELLAGLSASELKNTAVVLGDESLLLPVLNSLPPNVDEVNVTMGFPLKNAPVAFLFEHLLKMHSNYKENLYYKDILAVTDHPLVQKITSGFSTYISNKIRNGNIIFLTTKTIKESVPSNFAGLIEICFENWENNPKTALSNLQKLVFELKKGLDNKKDKLQLEFLYQFNLLFNSLSDLLNKYPYVVSIKGLFSIYKELVSSHNVDFQGKPFSGLQLMGVLESRVLDFKNVILTSVNEGVFPAGKSSNSFIPYDLKRKYQLPTYKEKDAVYTYHFYHLLQRAQNVSLLYNNDTEGFNAGEKSRFLLQLEMNKHDAHSLKKYNVTPKVPAISNSLKTIKKTPEVLEKIKILAEKGFSPSALTTYIRNPLDFYHQYILGIRDTDEVEETIAFNTLGTVVHDTLEEFYKIWQEKEISIDYLKNAKKEISSEVTTQFKKSYSEAPLSAGKNLLIFEVAKRYVSNFLNLEVRLLKQGNSIKILKVETNMKTKIDMPELPFPVYLRGKVDRVDEFNGILRVIDYKTGKVEQKQVEVVDWEALTTDYDKYSKSFQILTYAFMLNNEEAFTAPVEAGIISFKNLQSGFLKFVKKDKNGKGATKISAIDRDILENYKLELKKLILEICNPEIPFLEKEIPQKSW